MEQLQSASQRQDQTNAVERHVRHSCEMEKVRTLILKNKIWTELLYNIYKYMLLIDENSDKNIFISEELPYYTSINILNNPLI